jgi:Flp pilus assembly protein CpaB
MNKNMIPLILAVILGLAAVYAVNRLLLQKNALAEEEMIEVIAASRNLQPGEVLTEGSYTKKKIPKSARPTKAILWSQSSIIWERKLKMPVAEGDYILLDDVNSGRGLSDIIGEGEWAISISFSAGAVTKSLRPGDEIAILGTFSSEKVKKASVAGQKPIVERRKVSAVILPRVRILSLSDNKQQGGDEVVLALPPTQANTLLAAQARGVELYPALRKSHDDSNLNRLDTGIVSDKTFNKLTEGLEDVIIPQVPSKTKGK